MTSCKIRLSLQRPTKILFDFRMSSYVAHQLLYIVRNAHLKSVYAVRCWFKTALLYRACVKDHDFDSRQRYQIQQPLKLHCALKPMLEEESHFAYMMGGRSWANTDFLLVNLLAFIGIFKHKNLWPWSLWLWNSSNITVRRGLLSFSDIRKAFFDCFDTPTWIL